MQTWSYGAMRYMRTPGKEKEQRGGGGTVAFWLGESAHMSGQYCTSRGQRLYDSTTSQGTDGSVDGRGEVLQMGDFEGTEQT